MNKSSLVTTDAWQRLQAATPARIALGRAGASLPTRQWLDFKSAHASARQAVHEPFDAGQLAAALADLGVEVVMVDTAAADRLVYLQRPDLGRRLSADSEQRLRAAATVDPAPDLAIVVSDGLSPLAVHRQAQPLLAALLPQLIAQNWRLAPIVIARFGRVALQDQVGELLRAEIALMLIGERPGLGSPDSMGAYLVYAPRPGNTDANRNCVSNIRPEGLSWQAAADTIQYLLSEARLRRMSGISLKDERSPTSAERPAIPEN
jgi:ethanolamine ammonia-lyase small subunit